MNSHSQHSDDDHRRNDNPTTENDKDRDYIVMLPYMAHGHLIPFVALANQLLRRATDPLSVIIATTKLNINYLRSSCSSDSAHILFADLPFRSADHGLPPDTENTENLPLTKISDFLHASRALEAPCRVYLRAAAAERGGRAPLCLISDVFLGWGTRVAADAGTVNVTFSTGGAYGTAAYVSLWLNLPHRKIAAGDSEDEFAVPGFPERCRFSTSQLHRYLRSADGTDAWSRFFQSQISMSMESHAWLCCTIEEFEPLGLEILRNSLKTPVWPVGPLLPPAVLNRNDSPSSSPSISRQRIGKECGVSVENCLEWLDSQAPKSSLYVSFGSQNTIGAPEMMELAIGLEKGEKPFVWVIRPPLGFDPKEEFKPEWLPPRFEERMKEKRRGLLVRNWAPQLDILSHRSTGAFLSHCGWNSVMEALSQGVPLVGWPLAAEQAYNAKMLAEESGVCVELARGGTGTGVGAEEVRSAVEAAIGDGEMRRRAEGVMAQIRAAVKEGGSAFRATDGFLASLAAKREEMYGRR